MRADAETTLVLALFNESSSSNLDWIGESVAHTVSEALASRGIYVVGREDREEGYKRLSIRPQAHLTRASVIKVGEALDASEVIYGAFEVWPPPPQAVPASRGVLRLKAFVLDMRQMRRSEELAESGPLEDFAQLQTRLAWRALKTLAPELAPSVEQFLEERPAARLDAMENYTRGLLAPNDEQKHRYFTQAVRLDENFAEPRFELGKLYWGRKEYKYAADWLSKVPATAPRYFEANFLLGLCRYYLGDFAGAQAAFERVADSAPLNEVFNNLAASEARRNLPGALESFRKALEGDEADPDYHFNAGYELWKRKEFAAAAESFRATLERDPEDGQASALLDRCMKGVGPQAGDSLSVGQERLKLNYEEGAYRQLKAMLQGKKNP
jgi:tetratricopeptide (TPR) repeat protein